MADEHVDPSSLLEHSGYHGDVTAIKCLLSNGAKLESLGKNMGLIGACFHGELATASISY